MNVLVAYYIEAIQSITDKEEINTLNSELTAVCCEEEDKGCSNCPVFIVNNNESPPYLGKYYGCDCFKNGDKMRKFIINTINK